MVESNLAASRSGFDRALLPAVSDLVSGRIKEGVAGASLTTFAIGGPLGAVVTVETTDELRSVVALLSCEGQTVKVLGFGSNLLISDSGCAAWVVRLGAGFRAIERAQGDEFIVSGAASFMALARKLSDEGFAGLEFAAGIPASVGGAVFMNAGAHGSELCERVVSVSGILSDGTPCEWKRDDLPWRYRSSGLPAGVVITHARLKLVSGDRTEISRRCAENLAHRRATQPLALPSAGSVFKNPRADLAAGRVLEDCGMKGVQVGEAMVSTLHANWIVNAEKRASARDVQDLIALCQARALAQSGLQLEPEVKFWE